MNVASLENCKELYELSGWEASDDDLTYYDDSEVHYMDTPPKLGKVVPAYDLGYLLRKLPFFHEYWNGGNEAGYLVVKHWSVQYEAGYWEENGERDPDNKFTSGYADSPEDALCHLAIKLFHERILKREDPHGEK